MDEAIFHKMNRHHFHYNAVENPQLIAPTVKIDSIVVIIKYYITGWHFFEKRLIGDRYLQTSGHY